MAEPQIIYTRTEDETRDLGRRIGEALGEHSVVSLRGPLGSGKTVIAKGIAQSLGITEAIVSPTFTLVQEYEGKHTLHHMDLYRIDSIEEFGGIGGEELLYSDGITLIEWSEKIDEILPAHTTRIEITILDDGERRITLQGIRL